MWISLIVALLTYLLQNPKNSKERKQALLGAIGAGAITYGISEYTDWGQDNLKPLDDSISDFLTPGKDPASGSTIGGATKPTTGTGAGGTGFWDVLTSWGPGGAAAIGAGVGVASGALPAWLVPVGIGLAAFLILK